MKRVQAGGTEAMRLSDACYFQPSEGEGSKGRVVAGGRGLVPTERKKTTVAFRDSADTLSIAVSLTWVNGDHRKQSSRLNPISFYPSVSKPFLSQVPRLHSSRVVGCY